MKRTERERRKKNKREGEGGTHKYVNHHAMHTVSTSDKTYYNHSLFNHIIMELKTLK